MLSRYHRQAVITGYVDSFCLVCERHLQTEEEINYHLGNLLHIKNLKENSFVEEYKDDCIRKVKKGYFCEFCNILLSTVTKVSLHVTEETHINSKGSQLLRRCGNSILFCNLEINYQAWHGFLNNTCVICDLEFNNESAHKAEPRHVLNLVQNKVQFADKNIYRMIGDTLFQCLTCNTILPQSVITTHFVDAEHNKLYNKCLTNRDSKTNGADKTDVSNKVDRNTLGGAIPKQSAAKSAAPAETPKKKSIAELQKDRPELNTGTKYFDEQVIKIFDAKDYIMQAQNGNRLCILCNCQLEIRAIGFHVKGKHHQLMLKFHKQMLLQNELEKEDNNWQDSKETLEAIKKFQEDVTIESNRAVCKQCSKSLELKYTLIEAHVEEHKKTTFETTSKPEKSYQQNAEQVNDERGDTPPSSAAANRSSEDNVSKFAEANNLQFVPAKNKVYCQSCDTYLSPSCKAIKSHINSYAHKKKVTKNNGNKNKYVKQTIKDFVKQVTVVATMNLKDVIINRKYCINLQSLLMFTGEDDETMKCESCNTEFSSQELDDHKLSPKHCRLEQDVRVIASIENEFIREARPEVFHCGYCNSVCPEGGLQAHLSSTAHREARTASQWRLQQYLPQMHSFPNREVTIDLLQEFGSNDFFF